MRMYAAFRIWNEYLRAREPRDRLAACDRFIRKMNGFTATFMEAPPLEFDPDTGRPQRLNISHRIWGSVPAEDTRLDLWYPDNKRGAECVAAYVSLHPLIIYYLNRLSDWGLYIRKCKTCGKIFLARSQRYELCSEKCRKAQALENKRDFDKRARDNKYDLVYKMNASTGAISSIRQRKILTSRLTGWKKCRQPLKRSKGRPAKETGD